MSVMIKCFSSYYEGWICRHLCLIRDPNKNEAWIEGWDEADGMTPQERSKELEELNTQITINNKSENINVETCCVYRSNKKYVTII